MTSIRFRSNFSRHLSQSQTYFSNRTAKNCFIIFEKFKQSDIPMAAICTDGFCHRISVINLVYKKLRVNLIWFEISPEDVAVAIVGSIALMLNHRMLMTLQHYDRHCSIHRWSLSYRSVLLTDCPDHTMLDVVPVVADDQYKCHRGHHPNHVFQVNQFHGQPDPKYIHVHPRPFLAAGISVNDSILRLFMQPVQVVLVSLFQIRNWIRIHINLHN